MERDINPVYFFLFLLSVFIVGCSDDKEIKVTTEKAGIKTIIETVSATGKIQPEVAVKISPDVSGEIVELVVKEGQHVEKGDLLLKIKPDVYLSTVDKMVANLNTSKANLENTRARLLQVKAQFVNTEASYKRNKKLFDEGAVSQAEYDVAVASYEGGKADVEGTEKNVLASEYTIKSAEAALKEANDNLAKTTIYAPVGGTISKLNTEKGERVVGTSQMAGTELMTIANLNEMEVRVEVNENDIIRVHGGDTSIVEVDSYDTRKFKGIVTEIASSANTVGVTADQVTNFTVKIRILQNSYKDLLTKENLLLSPFRPGMTATVDIQTKKVMNVIAVPIQSVTTRNEKSSDNKDEVGDSDKKNKEDEDKIVVKNSKEEAAKKESQLKLEEFVFAYEEGKVKLVHVKTGIQDNDYIEIIEGISKDKEIVSGPYNAVSKTLKDGMKVKKVDKKDLYRFSSGKN